MTKYATVKVFNVTRKEKIEISKCLRSTVQTTIKYFKENP